MAFQEIELNMIPHGDMPSFYASQYETGRPIIINVKMGEDDFACTDLYIELHARKVDDNIVTLEPDSVDGNQVVFVGTDQLFACPGKNWAELCLYADDEKDTSLGSLNFFIEVEPDPMAGGLTSETQIYDLYEQVEEITRQVIGDDYYDKTEVDDLLDDKSDKSDTYTKSQVDTALNLKADKSTTYTKTQTDNLLNDKADKATTYTKTQVDNALALKANAADLATVATTGDYDDLTNKPTIPAAQVQSDYAQSDDTKVDYIKNKPDLSVFVTSDALNEIIYDLLPVGSASGSIANFDTDLALPLVDCKSYIVASQQSGTPTPSSPLPISGYTEANITRCGVNLWDEEIVVSGGHLISKNYIPCKGGETYYLKAPVISPQTFSNGFSWYDKDKVKIGSDLYPTGNQTLTSPSNACFFKFELTSNYGTTYNNDISINYPATDTTYHAYNGQTFTVAFGQTVFDGQLIILPDRTYFHATHEKVKLSDLTFRKSGHSFYTRAFADAPTGASFTDNFLCSIFKPVNKDWQFLSNGECCLRASLDLSYKWSFVFCSDEYETVADFLAILTDESALTYPLATPIDIDLTPVQIRALVGVNNVFNDTNGNTEVQFKDSIQHYIDTRP